MDLMGKKNSSFVYLIYILCIVSELFVVSSMFFFHFLLGSGLDSFCVVYELGIDSFYSSTSLSVAFFFLFSFLNQLFIIILSLLFHCV